MLYFQGISMIRILIVLIHHLPMDKHFFKLEDENKELIYYSSKYNDFVIKGELKKKKIFGKTKYKIDSLKTEIPKVTDEWTEFNDDIKYITLKYKSDIHYIDCKGYKPEGHEISWVKYDGEKTNCWIYVIDKSPQNTDN